MCLPDPVSSSLVQSVMSMASSHSQHSHISTDTMSSMSGSYLAGGEGETGADDRGDVEAEEESQDASMESRGPSQQDGVGSPGVEGGGLLWILDLHSLTGSVSLRSFPRSHRETTIPWLWKRGIQR